MNKLTGIDFENILTIRAFEESLLEMFKMGLIGGTVHTCIGQEVNPVVLAKFKMKGDYVLSNHRGHGHYLAFNSYEYEVMLKEILGRNDGCSLGVGGSQHLSSENFLSNGIQGGMTPIGVGLSFALKVNFSEEEQNNSNCVFVFIGDGTLGQGVIYESFNMASKLKLPIIFILEDNGIAQSTPSEHTFAGDLRKRIQGFGLEYNLIEHIDEDLNKIEIAVLNARKFIPQFIHIKSSRLMSHSKGDDNRNQEYIENLKLNNSIELEILSKEKYSQFLKKKKQYFIDKGAQLKSEENYFIFEEPQGLFETRKNGDQIALPSITRYNSRINIALSDFLSRNSLSLVVGEDIRDNTIYPCDSTDYGGAFKVTLGLSQQYPSRILNFPISEQLIVGFSTGYSIVNGWTICEIMFADFLTLTVDQIIQHLSKFKDMLGGKHIPKVIIRTPIGGYRGYGPTHSQSFENLFIGLPNFNVIAMNKCLDPHIYYDYIEKKSNPTLLLENKLLYTESFNKSKNLDYLILDEGVNSPIVQVSSRKHASEFLVLTYGQMLSVFEEASFDLLIDFELGIDCLCYSDLNDFEITPRLKQIISKYKFVLILTETKTKASWSSQMAYQLLRFGKNNLIVDILGCDWLIPASTDFERIILPSKKTIEKWVQKYV